jgi:AraC-like DNA-binding protein
LNSLGIKYIKYSFDSVSSNDIFYLGANYFIGKEDVLLVMIIIFIYYSFMIIGTIYRIRKNAALLEKTKKTVLKFGLLYWSLSFSASILLSLNFVLILLKIDPFISLSKAISLCSFLILILIPSLLKEIASIKVKTEIEEKDKKYFNKIEQFFRDSKSYLDPKYGLANLSLDIEIRSDLIRKSIKGNAHTSVPMYINSYRIIHFCTMIDNGYLTQFSMDALAEQSVFSSQPTFNRIFKSIKNQTPSEYADAVKFI